MIIKNSFLILLLCLLIVFINGMPQILSFIYSLESLVWSISVFVNELKDT